MAVTIREVSSKKELKQYIWFGINLYKDCEFAAPPLLMDDLLNLTKGKNPALDFCEATYYMAFKDNKIVSYSKSNPTKDMEYIDYGLAIINKAKFSKIGPNQAADLSDLFEDLVKSQELHGYEIKTRFFEIGSFSGIKDIP